VRTNPAVRPAILLLWSFLYALLPAESSFSQVIVEFDIPDTVCVGQEVAFTNLSQGASAYFWNFTAGDHTMVPMGTTVTPPGHYLGKSVGIVTVASENKFYSFVTNRHAHNIVRNVYSTNFLQTPVSVNLGDFGVFTDLIAGIELKYNNGQWYGFVLDGDILYRLEFGVSLDNAPVVIKIGSYANLNEAYWLDVEFVNGQWIGFCTSRGNSTISRILWGSSLSNTPTVTDMGNIGNLNTPAQCCIINNGGAWYLFVVNVNENSVSRLEFGASLLNSPVGFSIPGLEYLQYTSGIAISGDCSKWKGFVANDAYIHYSCITGLNFPSGLTGPISTTPYVNLGPAANCQGMSDLFRVRDTVYSFITNGATSTLTLIYFPGKLPDVIPASQQQYPDPIIYNTPGRYNIVLTADLGLATQQSFCKQIVVMALPEVNLGNDTTICFGSELILHADTGFSNYQWSTGDQTPSITISQEGTYTVSVEGDFGCIGNDTIHVFTEDASVVMIDTMVCFGVPYFAENAWRYSPGNYVDTLPSSSSCDSLVITNLSFTPEIPVDIGADTSICPGSYIQLASSITGDSFEWQDGTIDSIYVINDPGIYWLHVFQDDCFGADTVQIWDCPAKLWFPTAFTPNGDGLNDTFRPRGINITSFHMMIYSRWGELVFETQDLELGWDGKTKGELCPSDTYTFIASYNSSEPISEIIRRTGTVVLIR